MGPRPVGDVEQAEPGHEQRDRGATRETRGERSGGRTALRGLHGRFLAIELPAQLHPEEQAEGGQEEPVAAVKKLRAGETLMPPREVTELLRFAREERERERESMYPGRCCELCQSCSISS